MPAAKPPYPAEFRQQIIETTFVTDTRMFLDHSGYLEETFFTHSYSPIRDESGG